MHTIKILGKGCGRCEWTEKLVREVAAERGVDATIEKVTRTSEMIRYQVLATPAVVIDEVVVLAGRIPTRAEVEGWLAPRSA